MNGVTVWITQRHPLQRYLRIIRLSETEGGRHRYRSCLGVLRLHKRYGADRLEAACRRALRAGARSYRNVAAILERGLDRMPLPDDAAEPALPSHGNVRGPGYYQ